MAFAPNHSSVTKMPCTTCVFGHLSPPTIVSSFSNTIFPPLTKNMPFVLTLPLMTRSIFFVTIVNGVSPRSFGLIVAVVPAVHSRIYIFCCGTTLIEVMPGLFNAGTLVLSIVIASLSYFVMKSFIMDWTAVHHSYAEAFNTMILSRSVFLMMSFQKISLYPSRLMVVDFGVRPNELFCARYGFVTVKSDEHTLSIGVPSTHSYVTVSSSVSLIASQYS